MKKVKITDNLEITVFTQEEIDAKGLYYSKKKLAEDMGIDGITFDYALPQQWLNRFVEETGLEYDKVRFTSFAVYHGDLFGVIVSGLDVVQAELDKEK